MVEEAPTLISTPLGRSSYSFQRQSSENLDITEAAERGVAYEKGFTESSLIGSRAIDWAQQAISAIKNEPKLSAKEANERYGINGLIQFEEPIPASLAEARMNRALQSRERDEILAAESVDNTGLQNAGVVLSGIGGALTDLTTILPVAGPTGNLMKATAGMKALQKATALRGALLTGGELLASQAPKSPLLAGAIRGIADVTIPNAITEGALYDNAMKNGYDYDTGLVMMFLAGSIPVAGGLGAIGTKFGKEAFMKGQKNITSIFGVMGDYGKGTKDAEAFFNRAATYDMINKNILDNIVVKQTAALLDGVPMSQDAIRATLRLSDQTDDVQKFITNLESGRYGSVIDEKTGRMLKLDDVSGMRKAGSDFKAFVMNAIDQTLGSNRMFRALVNSTEIGLKYGAEAGSLGKVNKLIDSLTNKITELNVKVQKASDRLASAPTAQRATRFAEHDALNKELQNLIQETEQLKSFKSLKTSDRLDDLIGKTELKDYTQVTSDTFKADYKKLRDRIRDRKIKGVDNFFGLSEDAQRDLYKLYSMLGEDVGQNRSLQDLMKLNEEELLMRHQNGIYKAELEPMTREQALKILRDEYLDPEIKIRQAAKDLTQRMEREVSDLRDIVTSSIDDLQKELQGYSDIKALDDPEIKVELQKMDEEFAKDTNVQQGKQAAWDCVMRSFING